MAPKGAPAVNTAAASGKKRGSSPSQRSQRGGAGSTSTRSSATSARAAISRTFSRKGGKGKVGKVAKPPESIAEEETLEAAPEAAVPTVSTPAAAAPAAAAQDTEQTPQAAAAAVRPHVPDWTHKAYGLFDRIDVDKSGFIDRDELMSKLKQDGELEELLGAKRWGIASAAAADTEHGSTEASPEEQKKNRAKARAERRNKLLEILFDEFDVTETTEGVVAPTLKFKKAGDAKPAQGRELVSDDLVAALSKKKGDRRGVARSDAKSFAVKCASGETFDGFQHDDFVVLPTTGLYYQLSSKDDKLNRDEFHELVRLGPRARGPA